MKVVKFFGDKKKKERKKEGVRGMEGGEDGERKKRGKTGWKEGGREARKKENKLNWPFEQAVSIASGRRIIQILRGSNFSYLIIK